MLGASEMTIRRDLKVLDADGRLEKVRGGAVPVGQALPPLDRPADVRSTLNLEAKLAIGRAAAAMVPDGATLILDSGTTVGMLARALRGRVTVVVTTSLRALSELRDQSATRIHLIGGRYRPETDSVTGPEVVTSLTEFSADLAFLGASAVRAGSFYNYYPEDAPIQRTMARLACQAWLLVDSSKLTAVALGRVGALSDLTGVITDQGAQPELLERLRGWCRKLLVVPLPGSLGGQRTSPPTSAE